MEDLGRWVGHLINVGWWLWVSSTTSSYTTSMSAWPTASTAGWTSTSSQSMVASSTVPTGSTTIAVWRYSIA